MKGFAFFIALCGFTTTFSYSQTTLNLGDVAFTGVNTDTPDDFTFIFLVDVTTGTQLSITDEGWFAAGGFRSGPEQTITWTATEDYSCGTQITIDNGNTTTNDGGYTTSGTVSGVALSLSIGGEALHMYQGTAPTAGNQSNFVTSIQVNGGGWDADATSNTTSAKPSIMTDGVNSMSFTSTEVDNQTLNPALCGSVTSDITVIYNESNWIRSNAHLATPACTGLVGGPCGSPSNPEIDIEGNTTSIPDGDVTPILGDDTDFGTVVIGATATNTFTIQNEGTSDLTLSGGPNFVSISGDPGFTILSQPSGTIAAGGTTTFQVRFSANCGNPVSQDATVSVSSDDGDESPYTFDVDADITGVDTDSDGLFDLCDPDDDNDGIADGSDPDDTDFNICGDSDADGCDDCSVTNDGFGALSDSDPANDGTDSDCDGICDATDPTDNSSMARGNMLTFDGVNDYVSLGNISELDFGKSSTFTIEAWINTSSGGDIDIISKYGGFLVLVGFFNTQHLIIH